jgi:hypothetical protein
MIFPINQFVRIKAMTNLVAVYVYIKPLDFDDIHIFNEEVTMCKKRPNHSDIES